MEFEIKQKVFLEALEFLNDYISWLTIDPVPIRKLYQLEEFTLVGRSVYEKLCLCAESPVILQIFLDILFGKTVNVFVSLNEFRKEARKELHLKPIDFDENRAFLSCISTLDLEKKREWDE